VTTQRTVIERLNLDRLRAHIVEAAEQCGRTVLPELSDQSPLAHFLEQRDASRTLYFADENGGEPAASTFKPGPAMILTGPEGGFTDAERSAIRAAPNTVPISLGPRILRAETAALAALAAYMTVAGDWR
jgi:16S rRNA (uracil1498-N3)-methyltransferase